MGIGGSYHKLYGWKSQYERAKRWHRRIQKIKSSIRRSSDRETDFDFIYAFFQNCFQLRDWLTNTDTISKKDMDKFFYKQKELVVCREICVGLKHFKIREPKVDKDISIIREYEEGNVKPYRDEAWVVLAGGLKYDLFELANKCMNLWEDFLKKKNLIKNRK